MKKLFPHTLAALAAMLLGQGCTLDTMGEGGLFGEGGPPLDTGVEAAAGSSADATIEPSSEVGTGGASGASGAGGMGGSSGSGGASGEGGAAGEGGSAAAGGASGAGGMGGSSGEGGTSGTAGDGGVAGSGGMLADAGDEDVADAADAVSEDAADVTDAIAEDAAPDIAPDVADAVAEDAAPDSSDAAEEPDAPWPTSPCGPIPPTGYAICWVYDHPAYPALHMGLAGGYAGPGHFIENEWKDPMVGNGGNCVAATGAQSHVLCTLDEQPIGTVVMFAGGLHQSPSSATEPNNWACDLQQCFGEAYAYHGGVEIGKYVNGQAYAKVHTVAHFVSSSHLDLAFNIP